MGGSAGYRRGVVRSLDIAMKTGRDAILAWAWDNSIPEPNTGCWLFTGPVQENGYGYIVDPRKPFNRASAPRLIVPRLICETVHGEKMPTGVVARHTCDNPPCINPAHLVPGTKKDNFDDAVRRNRWTPNLGTTNGRALVTEDQVREIRKTAPRGAKREAFGAQYGLSGSMVGKIVRRENWKHVA